MFGAPTTRAMPGHSMMSLVSRTLWVTISPQPTPASTGAVPIVQLWLAVAVLPSATTSNVCGPTARPV